MTTFQTVLFGIDVLLAAVFSVAVISSMAMNDDRKGLDYLIALGFIALFTLQAVALYKG